MIPDYTLRRYVRHYGGPAGSWAVFVHGRGDLANCPTAAGAIAAMRLLCGEDAPRAYAAYLRGIGCTPGHTVLDALDGRPVDGEE